MQEITLPPTVKFRYRKEISQKATIDAIIFFNLFHSISKLTLVRTSFEIGSHRFAIVFRHFFINQIFARTRKPTK